MWISYGTLIVVWYCPVVMGKKNPQEQYVDFLWHINCCVVLSCGNEQNTPQEWAKKTQEWAKNHRNSMWISYRTLIAVWYCPVVMGKKTTGIGKKTHRNSMWISYGTLNPVWYCPVVMGKKKPTGMGKKPQEWAKNPQEYYVVFPMVH